MKQITAIRSDAQFIFNECAYDKWMETHIKRFDNEYGDPQWSISHVTKYTSEASVEAFAAKLEEIGFTIIR